MQSIISVNCLLNFTEHVFSVCVRGASKIKLKNVNKKRMATARRLIFLELSRHPLLIGLHCCFHHYKTLKAVAMATATIVLLTPASFYNFGRPKFNFQPLSFTFETFGKKLAETKIVARVNGKKIKAKNFLKKAFKSPAMKGQRLFTKIFR